MDDSLKHYINIRLLKKGGKPKSSFGPGTAMLLRGIRETGSINQATKAMGMAYSKAWRVIGVAEEELGFSLIERMVPKGSILTKEGELFLKMYEEMEEAADKAVAKVLESYGK